MSSLMEQNARAATNAHWASVSFQQLLGFGSDRAERAELLTAGVSPRRVAALYPPRDYADLMPGIIEHMRAHPKGITMWLVMDSDPEFITPPALLSAEYRAEKAHLFDEEQGFHLLRHYLSLYSNYLTAEMQSVQSLLWHAWWMMSHRQELVEAQREVADKLMLSAIEYVLPNLKVPGQPRYF